MASTYELYKKHYEGILNSIKTDGLFKDERLISSPQGALIKVEYPKGAAPAEKINMCANNYLGLSSHPEIIRAAQSGLEQRGFGMSSVRFICGTQDIHRELETKVSQFLKMEDTILFSSCFDANGALFETLLGPEDFVFSDKLVHASLIDGMRLCKAQKFIYEHSDLKQLEQQLKDQLENQLKNNQGGQISQGNKTNQANKTNPVKMIITDGVFSMDGDMARLDELAKLAEKYQCLLAVDDSHATGFIGKTGRGTHEHFNVMDKVDIITTTFGKALGGATGGCISGRKELIALLKQRGRPYLFSNALMPAVVMASMKALNLITESTERRDKLESLSSWWRQALIRGGFDIKPGNTPIVPVMLYDAKLAQMFSRELYEEGVFAVGFFYPVVPQGQARIRTQISAALDLEHLEKALKIFLRVGEKFKILGLKKEEIIARSWA